MLLKLLVCIFSIVILVKNISYAKYEYTVCNNSIGAVCISVFVFITVTLLNIILFFC